jgi:Flp pilus assembly protein TadB
MPGLPVLLTIIFVILKLTGVIAWGWLWVLSPLWISAMIALVLIVLAGTFMKNAMNFGSNRRRR